jgi:hypothetical protein
VECEIVARARQAAGYFNPEGLTQSPNFTHVAGIPTRQMVWSGLYPAGECTEQGVRRMFAALSATLKNHGATVENVAMSYL